MSVSLAQIISSLILMQLDANLWTVMFSALFLLILLVSFVLFTLRPPKETDFFKDPVSLDYGLKAHR